ncbi:hypothetical protein Tco_0321712 [Tanacetum coccineum]
MRMTTRESIALEIQFDLMVKLLPRVKLGSWIYKENHRIPSQIVLIATQQYFGIIQPNNDIHNYKLQQDDLEGMMEIEHKPGSSGAIEEGNRQPKARAPAYSGSKFRVGEGKVVSMGGIGGAKSIRKAWGEVGGVENNSSMGSMLMARDDVSLEGWVGTGRGEVKGGGVDLEKHPKPPFNIATMNVFETTY